MGSDQPRRQLLDFGQFCGNGQRLDVAGAVEQLVLEREITQQRLVERFGLLSQRFHRGSGAPQDRSQNVGEAPEVTDRSLDTSVALPRRRLGPGRVPEELARWLVGQDLDVDIPHAGGRTAVTDTVRCWSFWPQGPRAWNRQGPDAHGGTDPSERGSQVPTTPNWPLPEKPPRGC